MRYTKTVLLAGGVELLVRNAVASDARALRDDTAWWNGAVGNRHITLDEKVR